MIEKMVQIVEITTVRNNLSLVLFYLGLNEPVTAHFVEPIITPKSRSAKDRVHQNNHILSFQNISDM